ncbi:MAG: glutamyl-tRNA reductase [Burkholderiales bacterium]
MTVFALGLNHATAPLALRERIAVAADALQTQVQALHGHLQASAPQGQPETALLSTCNRTELYVAGGTQLAEPALEWLAQAAAMPLETLKAHSYLHHDGAATRHAFRVASGLDSMVLGESQILGQFKHAVRQAGDAGTLGTTLHQLFQRSFAVAKDVRSSTEIGAHSISMAAAAVRLAGQLFEDLAHLQVLFIGAGEMIELAATHFAAKHPKRLVVMNRTLDRATALSHRFNGQALPLSELESRLAEFDAVISCTAAPEAIVRKGMVERALKSRKRRPMFIVDLAVPRDIEASVRELSDVYLYTVDDLSGLVQTAGAKRQAAVAQAEAIIETGVQSFQHWQDQRQALPFIQTLQQQVDDWREQVLTRSRKALHKGESPEAVLEAFAHQFSHKMLHGIWTELHASEGAERERLEALLTKLLVRRS